MSPRVNNAAEAAAFLTGDPEAATAVKNELSRTTLIDTLVAIRVGKRMTQKELAHVLKWNPSKVCKMERTQDVQLHWGDVVAYAHALDISMSILFDSPSLPKAHRVKQHVFAIKDLLDDLVALAKETDEDDTIPGKIHLFFGEVLLNFLQRFSESYSRLPTKLKIGSDSPRTQEALPTHGTQSHCHCRQGTVPEQTL